MRYRKVLYATDLSPCARQAFAPAASFARRYDAELHLLHVFVLPGQEPYDPLPMAPPSEEAYANDLARAAKRLLALADSSCADGTRLIVAQRCGPRAAAAILDYAAEAGVDLIVMGTHGRSGAGRLLLGSVAEEVTRRAPCPVLVMRQLADGRNRPVPLVRHIVVPVDFSLPAEEALLAAGDVAVRYGARVTLLHVIEEPSAAADPEAAAALADGRPELDERVTARAERRLRATAAQLPPGVPHDVVLRRGVPAAEIAAFAARTGADLVVMSSRGLAGIERLVFGSTAEQVVRTVDARVMVVHPRPMTQPDAGRTLESSAAGP